MINNTEPLETKEVKKLAKTSLKYVTRTKLVYRLTTLMAEGLIKGKFVGPEKVFGSCRRRTLLENQNEGEKYDKKN